MMLNSPLGVHFSGEGVRPCVPLKVKTVHQELEAATQAPGPENSGTGCTVRVRGK